jgi:hypothetical protein
MLMGAALALLLCADPPSAGFFSNFCSVFPDVLEFSVDCVDEALVAEVSETGSLVDCVALDRENARE